MPLFSEGFLRYFTSSQFCDMTLVVRNREYKAHRIILVYNSGYFAQKLAEPKYAQQRYVHFVLNNISDPHNLFPLILKYAYEGQIKITDDNCVPLLALAISLEMEDLKKRIANFLSNSINRKNVLFVLQKAMEFNQEDVKKQCLLVLARNFSRIVSAEPFETPSTSSSSTNIGFQTATPAAGTPSRSHLKSGSYNGVVERGNDRPGSSPGPGPHTVVGFNQTSNTALSSSSGSSLSIGGGSHTRTHKRGNSNNSPSNIPISSSAPGLSTSPPGGSSASSTTWSKSAAPWSNVTPTAVVGTVYAEQESPFKCLPVDLMLTLLRHVGLAVMNENLVYKAVVEYIKAKGDLLSEEDCTALFEQVRFPFLNYQQLQEVLKNPAVPQRLVAEALIVRLGTFEAPNTSKLQNKLSLQKRTTCGLFFEYSSEFDDKGVLHWIATQGHTTEWVNPIRYGVKVTASSTEKGVPNDVLENKPTECWTKDVPSSWFAFDLGKNRQLVVTYYTLRHGSNSRQDCLRNWVLQSSDDGVEWETIKRHVNECVLNSGFAAASWPVPCLTPHRYFRVLQTGHNSTNKNFFSLSGIEFYGDFYQQAS